MQHGGNKHETLAILVGGGPAPGINGVIASATIEAIKSGLRVIGLMDGYRWLAEGDGSHTVELGIEQVSRIHFNGGSILRTSRTNPARDEATLSRAIAALEALGVRYLVCIGGDDTTWGAAKIAERTRGRLGVATVPKTIDNDLPLPENAPTFGFETARTVGASIIEALMEDARTTRRWYLAVSMGRKSGSLALSMCKSAGATLAVIPEEFRGESFDLGQVVDTIVGAIIKRRAGGRDDGVAVIAEGIVERMDKSSLPTSPLAQADAYGHLSIADIPLAIVLRDRVRAALKQLGIDVTVVAKDIGYELRCAKPLPFDAEYTRTLGYGAVRYLLGGGSGALIAIAGGRVTPVEFSDLVDGATGRVRVRLVDVSTESYQVARSYMIRLEPRDFDEPALSMLARHAHLSTDEFKARFLPTVESTVP
ncbi:MAG TPA: diphosphate--fructose-6-phosphate 1-phosphotransferase [Candidatus Binataceae bacterium]|jgi:6-phosphofructokinase 1|nr:diphosphate--fructose-6-phosphate 1-phosphotransferase [Candidatus Binataceae bacterium]